MASSYATTSPRERGPKEREEEHERAPEVVLTVFRSLILESSYHLDALGPTQAQCRRRLHKGMTKRIDHWI